MTAIIRRLGFGELRMHLMHTRLGGTTQGALGLRLHGALEIERLVLAADAVKARHALLDVVIVEHDGEPCFAHGTGERAYVVVHPPSPAPASVLAAMVAENERILEPERCTWRLAVFPHPGPEPVHDLVLVMHHAILDARGTDLVLDELLRLCAGETLASVEAPSPVPPAAESACATTWSWERFSAAQAAVAEQVGAIGVPKHRQHAPLAERRTVVEGFVLDEHAGLALRERAAVIGTSAGAMLCAALLAAVRAHSPERRRFAAFTAVSLHRLCPSVREEQLGCYLSVVPTFHALESDEVAVGPLALEHQAALHRSFLAYGRPPADHPTSQVRASFERLATIDAFTHDVGFTHAQSRLRARYGELRVGDVHVAARRSLGNVAIVAHALELGDRISLTVCHTVPLQDSAWAAAVTLTLARSLRTGEAMDSIACPSTR
jgi:hypothetical protein